MTALTATAHFFILRRDPGMIEIGDLVQNRYRVLKPLGKGGMGSVFLAEDMRLGRNVALKVSLVESDAANQADWIERFQREARAAASLRHHGLPTVHDSDEWNGVHFLTMEFIEGESLHSLAVRRHPFPIDEAVEIVRDLANAMAAAHERNVIHRDLKPANVMMRRTRTGLTPVIVDFGLARRESGLDRTVTQTGQVLGTPHYMSPEQIDGKTGPFCDVYALGVIFYELLTGRVPFDGSSPFAVVAQIVMKEPEPPSLHRPGLDPRLERICLKAMAKAAKDRYSSMDEFARALDSFVATPFINRPPQQTAPSETTVGGTMDEPFSYVPPVQPLIPERKVSPPVDPPPKREPQTNASPVKEPERREPLRSAETGRKFSLARVVKTVVIAFMVLGGTSRWFLYPFLMHVTNIWEKATATPDVYTPSARASDDDSIDTNTPSMSTTPSGMPAVEPQSEEKREDRPISDPGKPPQDEAPSPAPSVADSPKTWTNPTTGMPFLLIPAGEFQMGSNKAEDQDAEVDEMPRHLVRITKPFYLGKYEVTRGEFRKFVEATGFDSKEWLNPGFSQTDDHPAVNVSWNEAQKFCEWLNSKHDGYTYRLPTEAEWEYACRAGSKTRYCYGDDPARLSQYGNVYGKDDGYERTAPVGSFKPNAWGLFDMHGNVWEWCSDGYDGGYYKNSPMDDPPGVDGASDRVDRGGSWFHRPRVARSANRDGRTPVYRNDDLGFRLAAVRAEQ